MQHGDRAIIATRNATTTSILKQDEASLSEPAWLLGALEDDEIALSHPDPLESLSLVRAKVYGKKLDEGALQAFERDITAGRYSDIQLSAFITAGDGQRRALKPVPQVVQKSGDGA